ncbi:site-specific DNA-methyltransferase [Vibrio gangliei]|uniref:site-specific DNA-methyltransferase n=1 Tax=Vibrio gangliei TaxID=2077090 RepID=UPI000D017884|nr:site-specific DNA-methyltransferase [Vibrio gangliei]
MEQLKMHSPNMVDQNIEKLAELFPGCVTEAQGEDGKLRKAIDFDLLKQELSRNIVEGPQERYQLNWPGKREALLTANAPIAKTLRPCREESVDFDTTQNLFIEGDNLDALKLLQETYLGKVKMIYIDPPYNTGNDFIYEDDFAEDVDSYIERSNQIDEEGNRLVSNTESNGRFHSDWLSMLLPRIKLSYNLLKDDGFLVVSIDDAEVKNLISVLDEVFGRENQIATLVWDKNRKNDAKYFSVGHEYMLIYSKSKLCLQASKTILREPKPGIDEAKERFDKLMQSCDGNIEKVQSEWRKYYNQLSKDHPHKQIGRFGKISEKGPFRDDGNISWPGGGGPKYEVLHPETNKPCKVPDGGWRYSKPEKFWEEVALGKVVFGEDETTLPRQCRYLFEGEGQVMTSVHYSYAQTSAVEFEKLMGGKVFENPKNYRDIERLIRYLGVGSNDTVLDFFGGSGTTAHAVLTANENDNGTRRFILVQIPELVSKKSVAHKHGYKTISDLCMARIKKVSGRYLGSESKLDHGFRVLKVDSSNMADVYYQPDTMTQEDLFAQVDNVKEGRTEEDLLFQVMLDWGVDLTLPIRREIVDGKTVFFVADNALVACFDKESGINEAFVKELAKSEPLRLVFRDAGFASDSTKINVEQVLKQLSPNTDVKSI